MLREGPMFLRRSSMRAFQVSLVSRVKPKYSVLLAMGMGLLFQTSVASMMVNGRS